MYFMPVRTEGAFVGNLHNDVGAKAFASPMMMRMGK